MPYDIPIVKQENKMLVKIDGELVAQLQGYAWTVLMMSEQPDVKDALEGRVVVDSVLHASGRSINLITAPYNAHLPHIKRQN